MLNNSETIQKYIRLTIEIKVVKIDVKDQADYANKCFKSIVIRHRMLNTTQFQSNTINMETNKLVYNITLANLHYLTEYLFEIDHIQYIDSDTGNRSSVTVPGPRGLKFSTCFSRPEHPNVETFLNKQDGSIRFKLTPSQANDAPYNCYYDITVADFSKNILTGSTSNETEFKTGPSDNIGVYFRSVNDLDCYLEEFPFASECRNTKFASNVYVVNSRRLANGSWSLTWKIIPSIDTNALIQALSSTTKYMETSTRNGASKLLIYTLKLPYLVLNFIFFRI
jgi:hypothetical protein